MLEEDPMPIPAFRDDGYLPEGCHEASEAEVIERFGRSTPRREYLIGRLSRWLELARAVGARRFFVNGSFVTGKAEPGDVDAVIWLPSNFGDQLAAGTPEAHELRTMFKTREPEELFPAPTQQRWESWLDFFSQTRELDGRRKGVVEVTL
jgi:uncharacterized protein DUF6932